MKEGTEKFKDPIDNKNDDIFKNDSKLENKEDSQKGKTVKKNNSLFDLIGDGSKKKEEEKSPSKKDDLKPVIVRQFPIEEALENELVQKVLSSAADWLITSAETSKLEQETEQERIKANIEITTLSNSDKINQRGHTLKENIIEKVYNLLLLGALTGIMFLLWKMNIVDGSVVQTFFLIIAALVAGRTNLKSLINKSKDKE